MNRLGIAEPPKVRTTDGAPARVPIADSPLGGFDEAVAEIASSLEAGSEGTREPELAEAGDEPLAGPAGPELLAPPTSAGAIPASPAAGFTPMTAQTTAAVPLADSMTQASTDAGRLAVPDGFPGADLHGETEALWPAEQGTPGGNGGAPDRSGALRLKAALTLSETHFAPVVPGSLHAGREAPLAPQAAAAMPPLPGEVAAATAGGTMPPRLVRASTGTGWWVPGHGGQPGRADRATSGRDAIAGLVSAPQFGGRALAPATREAVVASEGSATDGEDAEAILQSRDAGLPPASRATRNAQGVATDGAGQDRRAPAATPADAPQAGGGPTAATVLPATEIRRLVGAIAQTASVTPPSGTTAFLPATATGPVRVVSLDLNPGKLGQVSVRLRLDGDRLSLRIVASEAETARMIEEDGDTLIRLLGAEGYDTDLVALSGAADLRGAAASAAPEPTATAAGGGQASHRRHDSGQPRRDDPGQHQAAASKDTTDEERTSTPRGSAVYV